MRQLILLHVLFLVTCSACSPLDTAIIPTAQEFLATQTIIIPTEIIPLETTLIALIPPTETPKPSPTTTLIPSFTPISPTATLIPSLTPVPPTETSIPENCVPWNEATYYIGEYKCVCGPVVGTKFASESNGQPTFLNLGLDYPNPGRFTVMIEGRNRNQFSNPEIFYLGKNICVDGLMESYRGVPEIKVSKPSQIKIR